MVLWHRENYSKVERERGEGRGYKTQHFLVPQTSFSWAWWCLMLFKQNQMKKQIQIICLSHHFPICWNKEKPPNINTRFQTRERKRIEGKQNKAMQSMARQKQADDEFQKNFVFMQHHQGEHEETIITSYTPRRRITTGGETKHAETKFLKRFNSEHIGTAREAVLGVIHWHNLCSALVKAVEAWA